MTYAVSHALQSAIYARLAGDAALGALVGGDIFDAPPSGSAPPTYVLIGDETVRDRSSKTHAGAIHDLLVSVITDTTGFATAKQVAGAVCDALVDAPLALSRGRLVALAFRSARARRDDSPGQRRIDLRFRAIVADQ